MGLQTYIKNLMPSYAKASLPMAGKAGRLARVSNNVRGLWMDQGTQWFGLNGEIINVREFGATGNGTTDDTAAIQAALDVGGCVYMPAGTYLVSSTLDLGSNAHGVRLLGAGNGFQDGTPGGTILKYTGSGACISVPGCYGFELAHFHIWGNNTGVDGISLVAGDASEDARSGSIYDVSMYQLTGTALHIESGSYLDLRNLNLNTAAIGLRITKGAAGAVENLRFDNVNVHSCTTAGLLIENGTQLSFLRTNPAYNATGIYIHSIAGATIYDLFFHHTLIDHSTNYGLEVYAENSTIGRTHFVDTVIMMTGAAAGEKAIYVHRVNGYTLQTSYFDFLDVYKLGGTTPTTSIDTTGAYQGELTRVRDASGGAHITAYQVGWGTIGPVLQRVEGWVSSGAQTVSLGTLPAYSCVTTVRLQVTQAFNSDGTDLLSVGHGGDHDAFATDTDVSTTGIKTPTMGVLAGYNDVERAISAYYTAGGSAPAAGKALVMVEFYLVSASP